MIHNILEVAKQILSINVHTQKKYVHKFHDWLKISSKQSFFKDKRFSGILKFMMMVVTSYKIPF